MLPPTAGKRRLFALRFESLLVPALFLYESSHGWLLQSARCPLRSSTLCDCGNRRIGGRKAGETSLPEPFPFFEACWLAAVGSVLIGSALALQSAGIIVFGVTALLAGVVIARHRPLAAVVVARIRAGLCVLLISLVALRLIVLIPARLYGPALQGIVRIFSFMCGMDQPGQLAEWVVFNGTEVHVSHFLGLWAFVPVTYAILVQEEPVARKSTKAAIAFIVIPARGLLVCIVRSEPRSRRAVSSRIDWHYRTVSWGIAFRWFCGIVRVSFHRTRCLPYSRLWCWPLWL